MQKCSWNKIFIFLIWSTDPKRKFRQIVQIGIITKIYSAKFKFFSRFCVCCFNGRAEVQKRLKNARWNHVEYSFFIFLIWTTDPRRKFRQIVQIGMITKIYSAKFKFFSRFCVCCFNGRAEVQKRLKNARWNHGRIQLFTALTLAVC